MGKLIFLVENFILTIFRLFYSFLNGGNSCLICGNKTKIYLLCNKCINEKFNLDFLFLQKRCKICGKEVLTESDVCMECRQNPVLHSLDSLIPLFSYRLWNKELLFLWKIQAIRSMSPFFAKLLNDFLKKFKVTCIVPVPPRPNKIRENGWDQIKELCDFLKYRFGFKVLNLLERKSVEQQKKLNRELRLQTIGKSYYYCNKKKELKELKQVGGVLPESVFLLDDVTTTGATVESCAQILKKRGVKKVSAVTLFIVD